MFGFWKTLGGRRKGGIEHDVEEMLKKLLSVSRMRWIFIKNDIKIGYDERGRNLIGKIIGDSEIKLFRSKKCHDETMGTKGTLQSDYDRTKCLPVCL